MYIEKNKDGEYSSTFTSTYLAFHHLDLKSLFKILLNYKYKFEEIEAAVMDLEKLGHKKAHFGPINRTYLYTE